MEQDELEVKKSVEKYLEDHPEVRKWFEINDISQAEYEKALQTIGIIQYPIATYSSPLGS